MVSETEKSHILSKLSTIVNSNKASKFNDIVELLNHDFGTLLFESSVSDEICAIIRPLNYFSPLETLYVWQSIYTYICKKEIEKNERKNLQCLYFYIGEAFFLCNKPGYGKFYLKAYVEDLSYFPDPWTGGAVQQLIARCGLGRKGVEMIHRELMVLTKTKSLEELKTILVKTSRGEFERLTINLENKLSLESNEIFFFPLSGLTELIVQIEPIVKKRGKEKAILLEQLCQLMFGSIPGFKYRFDDRSSLFQLDGFIKNNSTNDFLSELGKNIVVEAKQFFHRNQIGRKVIDIIIMNITRTNSNSAFLVTSGNLTGPAQREIYHNYLRNGTFIILITFSELKDLAEQKLSFPILVSKKISDIRMNRVSR